MVKIPKRKLLAIELVSVAVALLALIAYPAYVAAADPQYALSPENWMTAKEPTRNPGTPQSNVLTIEINAKGYAFIRIDEETIKQYECATNIVVKVQQATENTERKIDVTGSVKVNDATYTITSGKILIRKDRRIIFLNCTGADENGNQIYLKMAARYFWWGGKTYALRIRAIIQTAQQPMLLLQRGIAKIN